MKPIIGISGSILTNVGSNFNGYIRAYVNQDYVDSVLQAGGVPLILPMNDQTETANEMLKLCDGIILSGGHDVDPNLYGEEPLQKLGEICPKRDAFDIALYNSAIEQKKPILGICRGYQIINVINGGTLHQDLSYADGVWIRHDQDDGPTVLTHSLNVENDEFLNVGVERFRVNSFHHQILKDVAPGFNVVATSDDGVVEALQKIDDDIFIFAVQWHPEMLHKIDENSKRIFANFVDVVKSRKKK